MIKVTEYWNKVVDDPTSPFGRRVLPEYEVKSQWRTKADLDELKTRWKDHPRMAIEGDRIIEDKGRYFGIHSYLLMERG